MMPTEYNTVDPMLLKSVEKKWSRRQIEFEITGCSVWWHTDTTGANMWLVAFNIVSRNIFEIRRDLGLSDSLKYFQHMTVLEYEIK